MESNSGITEGKLHDLLSTVANAARCSAPHGRTRTVLGCTRSRSRTRVPTSGNEGGITREGRLQAEDLHQKQKVLLGTTCTSVRITQHHLGPSSITAQKVLTVSESSLNLGVTDVKSRCLLFGFLSFSCFSICPQLPPPMSTQRTDGTSRSGDHPSRRSKSPVQGSNSSENGVHLNASHLDQLVPTASQYHSAEDMLRTQIGSESTALSRKALR